MGRTAAGLVTLDFKARNRLRSRFSSCSKRAILLQTRDVSESPNLTLNRYPKFLMFPHERKHEETPIHDFQSYTRFSANPTHDFRRSGQVFGEIFTILDPMSSENGTCNTVNATLWPCLSVQSPWYLLSCPLLARQRWQAGLDGTIDTDLWLLWRHKLPCLQAISMRGRCAFCQGLDMFAVPSARALQTIHFRDKT